MQNILDHYTLAHINHFLREIDRVERRRYRESIQATRVAQLTQQGYEKYMRELTAAEKRHESKLRVVKGNRVPMTYEEQVRLEQQHHVRFSQMTPEKQAALTAQQESLWGQIPAHLQAKARKLAGR